MAATTGLGINVAAEVVERRVTALTGQELHESLEFEPSMTLDGPVGGVWRFASYVANEINRDVSLLSNVLLMEQFSETLLNSLLFTQPHNYSAVLNRQARASGPNYVRLAEEYLESHCDEPITVEQLAQVTGASVSALYAGFRRYRAFTPMQFLKQCRLRRARDQLLAAPVGTTVREVALRCGFSHLGRFSADYQRAFDESPSETLRQSSRYNR
jgi:AraC-like DNA-binding protein